METTQIQNHRGGEADGIEATALDNYRGSDLTGMNLEDTGYSNRIEDLPDDSIKDLLRRLYSQGAQAPGQYRGANPAQGVVNPIQHPGVVGGKSIDDMMPEMSHGQNYQGTDTALPPMYFIIAQDGDKGEYQVVGAILPNYAAIGEEGKALADYLANGGAQEIASAMMLQYANGAVEESKPKTPAYVN